MIRLFISHSSKDDKEASALQTWLAGEGYESIFLDFDPVNGIPAGVDWQQRLYQELRRCQGLIVVLTPNWLASHWCRAEPVIAQERGKKVFVVRAAPAPGQVVTYALQEVDLTSDRPGGLLKLRRGLIENGLDPANSFAHNPNRPIYPGLLAFDAEDAAIFFGREDKSRNAVEALHRMRQEPLGGPKLLLIIGASGSGKSSLMRAGVFPRLRKEQHLWIVTRPLIPRDDVIRSLAEALSCSFPEGPGYPDADALQTRTQWLGCAH